MDPEFRATSNEPLPDKLAEASRLGRLEAERLDLSLRELEGREREERLSRMVLTGDTEDFGLVREDGSYGTVLRLRQEVERLAAFHQAVLRSRPWRLIQAVRRLVGRAW